MTFLASIPSPSSNVWDIHLGSFHLPLHVYGLMIALGVLAAIWIARRRWAAWGHDPDLIIDLAYWGVPGGLIGARLYHVITDYNRLYVDDFWGIFKIWDGGLGIPGGILGGVLAGYICARRHNASVPDLLDMVAPAFPVAQAIGRLGNWFNQELFGRPTDLPWGLEIDVLHRPIGMGDVSTFQPTFAYEALWNLGLAGVLLGIDHRRGTGRELPRPAVWAAYGLFALGGGLDVWLVVQRQTDVGTAGQVGLFIAGAIGMAAFFGWASGLGTMGLRRRADLFITYVAGYFVGRLWVESLRIDTANTIAGLRINEWMAIVVVIGAMVVLKVRARSDEPRPIDPASGSVLVGADRWVPPGEQDGSVTVGADESVAPDGDDGPEHPATGTVEGETAETADGVAESDDGPPES